MSGRLGLLAIALLTSLLLPAALASAAPPAVPVRIDSVKVAAVAPLEGDNLTITVEITNNGSFPLTLSNLTVIVTGNGADPETVAALANVPIAANNTTRYIFHWVATAGVKVVTAQAFVLVGNDSFPLAPASARVQVDHPQTAEAGAVALVIALVLCGVILLAILPALFEHGSHKGRTPRAPTAPPEGQLPAQNGRA